MPRPFRLVVLFALCAAPAAAATSHARTPIEEPESAEIVPHREFPTQLPEAPEKKETPWILRWMIRPLKRGMFLRLPVIDTDPNRGTTFGVMPIWVLQGEKDERIEQIHAPSLTYNQDFRFTPTYRYYWYPQEDASVVARASYSKYEREAMGQWEDRTVLGTPYDVMLRVQYNVDAGQRFFGLGPDSAKAAEANYKEEYWQYKWAFGIPLMSHASRWRARVFQWYQSGRILNGPFEGLQEFHSTFPRQYSENYQQNMETRAVLEYDSRDNATTTTRGGHVEAFLGRAVRNLLSAYDYNRYGADARWFRPWESEPTRVFAIQGRFEQLLGGNPPFWTLPRLGGKYSLRAYGDGRYVDRGVSFVNVEQRFTPFEFKSAGVTTEFQIAPFAGAGTVYEEPSRASTRYVRPVVGTAFRAVAKPQVVGSIDFGVGREGLSVFMDINYSF